MSDLTMQFSYPWLLFLLIPALALVLFAFFKVPKKFRYTRSRVVSLSLGVIAAIACVLMVAGLSFSYRQENTSNEVILLVDKSASVQEKQDEIVKTIIDQKPSDVKLGVVTFGYDQVCAVPVGAEGDAYAQYLVAGLPDCTATDIASALGFARTLFSEGATGKIVVLSDGNQTDGDALSAVAALAMNNISVDFIGCGAAEFESEIQLIGLTLPQTTIVTGENQALTLSLTSASAASIRVQIFDNGKEAVSEYRNIAAGENQLTFSHAFDTAGLHELRVAVTSADDTYSQNNELYSYVYIDVVDKVLILSREDEAEALRTLFEDNFDAELRPVSEAPKTVEELREYDEVVLMNIANADMPEGFDEILNSYVYDFGGGLLTVGGTREEGGQQVANVYDRADMSGTLYEEMLPVLAEDYTPPVAVMLVIDVSYSMTSMGDNGISLMEEAKNGAKEGLKALDDRDYVGIVTFSSSAKTVLDLTPVSQKRTIESAIDRIEAEMSGTVYSNGLERAGMALKAMQGVNAKHIIFISDGSPSGGDSEYLTKTQNNFDAGITTSCISYYEHVDALENLAATGGGKTYFAAGGSGLSEAIKEDLAQPEIRDFEYGKFTPTIAQHSVVTDGIDQTDMPSLDGFFGAKLKSDAVAYLTGEYGQPIYAAWNYGAGKVGSFMCDLSGVWSSDLIGSEAGTQLICNIISSLFPKESIAASGIDLMLQRGNYGATLNVHAPAVEGDSIMVKVEKVSADGTRVTVFEQKIENFGGNSNVAFELKEAGVYEITAQKYSSDGSLVSENILRTAFSYSAEYDCFAWEDGGEFLASLAQKSGGRLLDDGEAVYSDLIMSFERIWDARIVLAAIVIVALLGDVAVRKFKFKWLHEIVRDRRAK